MIPNTAIPIEATASDLSHHLKMKDDLKERVKIGKPEEKQNEKRPPEEK
jgi:hypothetical protein